MTDEVVELRAMDGERVYVRLVNVRGDRPLQVVSDYRPSEAIGSPGQVHRSNGGGGITS